MSPTAMATPSSCMVTNIGAEAGSMPVKVSVSVRPMVTAGLAKLVDEVNQYAPAIHAATVYGTAVERPVRTQPWTTSRRPTVAINSEIQSGPEDLACVEKATAGRSNMTLARTVPTHAPITWAVMY